MFNVTLVIGAGSIKILESFRIVKFGTDKFLGWPDISVISI